MRELVRSDININFTSKFKVTSILSIFMVTISLILLFTKMNYGVDFRGGAEIQVKFKENVSIDGMRKSLKAQGFKGVSVQSIGEASENEVLLKLQGDESNLNAITEKVEKTLRLKDF